MLSFEGGTLPLRETATMLRSGDVIHRGPASFWCMIHAPVPVIISVLCDSPSYLHLSGNLCHDDKTNKPKKQKTKTKQNKKKQNKTKQNKTVFICFTHFFEICRRKYCFIYHLQHTMWAYTRNGLPSKAYVVVCPLAMSRSAGLSHLLHVYSPFGHESQCRPLSPLTCLLSLWPWVAVQASVISYMFTLPLAMSGTTGLCDLWHVYSPSRHEWHNRHLWSLTCLLSLPPWVAQQASMISYMFTLPPAMSGTTGLYDLLHVYSPSRQLCVSSGDRLSVLLTVEQSRTVNTLTLIRGLEPAPILC